MVYQGSCVGRSAQITGHHAIQLMSRQSASPSSGLLSAAGSEGGILLTLDTLLAVPFGLSMAH